MIPQNFGEREKEAGVRERKRKEGEGERKVMREMRRMGRGRTKEI